MSAGELICQEPHVDFVELDKVIHDEFEGNREAMIMMMQAIQRRYRFLPEPALEYLSREIGVPMTKIYEVATFYASFSLVPKGKHVLHICTGTACHLKGGGGMVEHVAGRMGVEPGGTTPDLKFTLEPVNCVGACAVAPVAVLDGKYHTSATIAMLNGLLDKIDAATE